MSATLSLVNSATTLSSWMKAENNLMMKLLLVLPGSLSVFAFTFPGSLPASAVQLVATQSTSQQSGARRCSNLRCISSADGVAKLSAVIRATLGLFMAAFFTSSTDPKGTPVPGALTPQGDTSALIPSASETCGVKPSASLAFSIRLTFLLISPAWYGP